MIQTDAPSVVPPANPSRLGIMQPYFFPYLGYFQLMNAVDHWIVFDTPQYIRKGWVNRNRVLSHGSEPWKYIHVPVAKHARDTPINKVEISANTDWKTDLIRNLDYYQLRKAPYRNETLAILEPILDLQTNNLATLLTHSLKTLARVLQILPERFDVFSEMNLPITDVQHPGQWALQISKALSANTYINPAGGQDIFQPAEFSQAGIELRFLEPSLNAYEQKNAAFVPGLSIIDVLMWNGVAGTQEQLHGANVVAASGKSPS